MVKASDMPDDGRATRQAAQRSRKPRKSQPQWPWLRPSIAVAIAPLRNLTSHPEQQFLVDDFTDRLGARPSNVTEPANLKFYCSLEDKQDTI
jgi:hypothetical protein